MASTRARLRGASLGIVLAVTAGLLPGAAASAGGEGVGGARQFRIETLSTAPRLVTGGDVLVEVAVPRHVRVESVRVLRGRTDVTDAFAPADDDPRRLVGLVDGLDGGRAKLVAGVVTRSGRVLPKAVRTVVDHPVTGPLFSGPHQEPFICRTAETELGPPVDDDCSAPTRVDFVYRSTDGTFADLPDPSVRPDDVATTTTRAGEEVDYVVRVETGTINRAIYRTAVLAEGGEAGAGWGGELVYTFGGGCGTGRHQGVIGRDSVLDDRFLSRGFAVATSSLNVNQTACNDVLSAETAVMVKERFIESMGRRPVWTMGWGGSGGAIQQLLIAHNYPGILDGLVPSLTFQDSQLPDPVDCRLLNRYFDGAGADLTTEQRNAVTGYRNAAGCRSWDAAFANVIVADRGCDPSIPAELIYDAETNPEGVRCTTWDNMVNVYGRHPETGEARRTLDNVGVQYGLQALRDGAIDLDTFLELNEEVGGYDADGNLADERSVAVEGAPEVVHRTGRIALGGALDRVPILDLRPWNDDTADLHTSVHSFVVRERLRTAFGDADNHVLWRAAGAGTLQMFDLGVDVMADWLDGIAAAGSKRRRADVVVAAKPAAATDACWTREGERIDEPAAVDAAGTCNDLYPPARTTRMAAGAPLRQGGVKCALRPVDPAEYGDPTAEQVARLEAVFPDGVCDYDAPPVGAVRYGGVWQSFGR